jgi:hypothetical protein
VGVNLCGPRWPPWWSRQLSRAAWMVRSSQGLESSRPSCCSESDTIADAGSMVGSVFEVVADGRLSWPLAAAAALPVLTPRLSAVTCAHQLFSAVYKRSMQFACFNFSFAKDTRILLYFRRVTCLTERRRQHPGESVVQWQTPTTRS